MQEQVVSEIVLINRIAEADADMVSI